MDFTIIIPSYNQGEFLDGCIQSIVDTRSESCSVEIILLDSESGDSTPEVIKKWESHIDIIIVEKDSGQTSAINRGFKLATGKYVNWLGCDDRLKKHSLSAVKSKFASSAKTQVVAGYSDLYRDNHYLCTQRSIRPSPSVDIRLAFPRIVQPSTFWRRSTFKTFSPLNDDLHYVMDLDIWLRFIMTNTSDAIYFTDCVLAEINFHDACKSARDAHLFESEILLCIKTVLSKCDNCSNTLSQGIPVGRRGVDELMRTIFSYRSIHQQLLAVKALDHANPALRALQSPACWIRYLLYVRPVLKALVSDSQYSLRLR